MIAVACRGLPPSPFKIKKIFILYVCAEQRAGKKVQSGGNVSVKNQWNVFCSLFWRCFFQHTPLQSVHLSSGKLLGEILRAVC